MCKIKLDPYLIYNKMLFLSRKLGESIVINKDIVVTVTHVQGNSVKLRFSYPQGVEVLRKEVFDRIEEENKLAALSPLCEAELEESLSELLSPLPTLTKP